jgi:alkylhydroperoxidase family enzyme
MARIPYVEAESRPAAEEVVSLMMVRRGNRLLNLDRMLLHSPPYAKGWSIFLDTVRRRLTLPAKIREVVICAVAVFNGAEYEFQHHALELLKAGGTETQVESLRVLHGAQAPAELFDLSERTALQLTYEMTRNVRVSDSTFAAIHSVFSDERLVVELVGLVAAYNMVSRFLVALEIEPE